MALARKITVIGSINMDLVCRGPRLPAPGETVLADTFDVLPGGKGANQALAAARLGGHVSMIGCVGRDDYGRRAKANLRQHRVGVAGVRGVARHTGVALICIDAAGRNLIAVAPGANSLVRASGTHDIVVTQLETPYRRPRAKMLMLNPAPAREVSLRGVDVVIPNEIEAGQLTGERQPDRAAARLRRMGARRAIITLGERGVWDDGHRPAFRVKAVDTVGAGDWFVGAFAAAVAMDHPDAVGFAQAAAALKCMRPGAQNGPTLQEVTRLLNRERERKTAR